jgi:hypothetical protein
MALYGHIIRAALGGAFTPTLDYATGKTVGIKDIVPFGRSFDEGYSMEHFHQDLAYTTAGSLIVAAPYAGSLANIAAAGEIGLPLGSMAVAAAPVVGVAAVLAAGVGTMIYIDSLKPGSSEYKTMSQLAYNIRM